MRIRIRIRSEKGIHWGGRAPFEPQPDGLAGADESAVRAPLAGPAPHQRAPGCRRTTHVNCDAGHTLEKLTGGCRSGHVPFDALM
ncbi:hypothetical protein QFZ82_005518 [Streptomyces sp. V4I23]|uniref:hypothetical protein n=1 Tax=Streptomyces sp. V4I23 TaxID=3042282 RepID=UPI002783A89D|nr:hypothetical protein [Streptomyces sp. V4I23]MDQ1011033.1 hypothetical protein [Streptomyces sp. V4I23]